MGYRFEKLKLGPVVQSTEGLACCRLDVLSKLPAPELSAKNGVLSVKDPSGMATEYVLRSSCVYPDGTLHFPITEIKTAKQFPFDLISAGWALSGLDLSITVTSKAEGYLDSDPSEVIVEIPHVLKGATWEFDPDIDTFNTASAYELIWDAPSAPEGDISGRWYGITAVSMLFESGGDRYRGIKFDFALQKEWGLLGNTYCVIVRRMDYVRLSDGATVTAYDDQNKYSTDDGFKANHFKTLKILHPPYEYTYGMFKYSDFPATTNGTTDLTWLSMTSGATAYGAEMAQRFINWLQANE
jgi:hypothetical protein